MMPKEAFPKRRFSDQKRGIKAMKWKQRQYVEILGLKQRVFGERGYLLRWQKGLMVKLFG